MNINEYLGMPQEKLSDKKAEKEPVSDLMKDYLSVNNKQVKNLEGVSDMMKTYLKNQKPNEK